MTVHDLEQGSADWMIARAGIPTASEFDQLVTPEFKIRTGGMPDTYLAKKLAEKWQGGPLTGFNSFDMDQGKTLEDEAIPWFSLQFNVPINRVAFITTDDGRVGCSPDGCFEDGTGIEVKCPRPETHTGYVLAGVLPKEYAAQVHGSMFVTGAKSWKFLSYRRNFPALVVTVERDERIQKAIGQALEEFLTRLDGGMKRMTELNGGPPPIRKITPSAKPYYMEDDVTP